MSVYYLPTAHYSVVSSLAHNQWYLNSSFLLIGWATTWTKWSSTAKPTSKWAAADKATRWRSAAGNATQRSCPQSIHGVRYY